MAANLKPCTITWTGEPTSALRKRGKETKVEFFAENLTVNGERAKGLLLDMASAERLAAAPAADVKARKVTFLRSHRGRPTANRAAFTFGGGVGSTRAMEMLAGIKQPARKPRAARTPKEAQEG